MYFRPAFIWTHIHFYSGRAEDDFGYRFQLLKLYVMFLLKWQTGVRQRRKHPLFLSFLLCWSEYLWSRARTLKKWLQCSQQRHWSLNLLLTLLPNTLAVIVCTRLTSEGQVECWLCSHVNFPLHTSPSTTALQHFVNENNSNICWYKWMYWKNWAMESNGEQWRELSNGEIWW